MTTTLWLRIAAVLTFIHALLHTIGGVFGKPQMGTALQTFIYMQAHRFAAGGHMRSYADYYVGFGLAISIFMAAEAVVLWLLASLARDNAPRLRPILWTFAVAYLALSVNSYLYFFAGPVIAELLIVGCLVAGIRAAKPHTA